MDVINVNLKRSHYGATADEVIKAFNVGTGKSTLLHMAMSAEHRPTVEEYRSIVQWKIENTEGEALAKWRSIGHHIGVVLAATSLAHHRRTLAGAEPWTSA